jgi:hypothetical protein
LLYKCEYLVRSGQTLILGKLTIRQHYSLLLILPRLMVGCLSQGRGWYLTKTNKCKPELGNWPNNVNIVYLLGVDYISSVSRDRDRVMVFNATFDNISDISWEVNFIGEGNQSTRRKPPTCRKSLTKRYHMMLYLAMSKTVTHKP